MNENGDAAVTKRILEAKRVIADPSSSSFDIFSARQELRRHSVDGWQDEGDRAAELQQLRSTVADPNASPIEVHAARERLKHLGAAAQPTQPNAQASPPNRQSTPEPIALYHRARGLTFLVLVSLSALLLYWLFKSDRTVDYYLNNYQERLEKIQECGQLPDITKDRECMNAITAQRMFIRR